MFIAKWRFKKEVRTLAKKVLNSEKEIDVAVDDFLTKIHWGAILGFLVRKIFGSFK